MAFDQVDRVQDQVLPGHRGDMQEQGQFVAGELLHTLHPGCRQPRPGWAVHELGHIDSGFGLHPGEQPGPGPDHQRQLRARQAVPVDPGQGGLQVTTGQPGQPADDRPATTVPDLIHTSILNKHTDTHRLCTGKAE